MGKEKEKSLVRELRPHYVWWGIEFTARKIVELLAGSAIMVAGIGLMARLRNHLDYVVLLVVFVLSIGVLLLAEHRSSSARFETSTAFVAPLKRGVTKLDCTDNEKVTFKNKVRFVFTNDGDNVIKVLPPSWIISKGDVSVHHPFTFKYQLEKSKGISSGGYKPEYWETQELEELHVSPGWSFTFYVGLDPTIAPVELEKRRGERRLGTIRIPVSAGDSLLNFEERV